MSNPISEIISDEQYDALFVRGLLKSTAVRNREIRRKYDNYKKCDMNPGEAILKLMAEFHLGRASIKSIVY